jgi:serine protease Do
MKTRLILLFCTLTITACTYAPRQYDVQPGERGESYAHAAALAYEVHTLYGMGSGWALDEDTIVTNWHVAEMYEHCMPAYVERNGEAWQIVSVERAPGADVALVHVEGTPLVPARIGVNPVVGDWVLMVGSPHDSFTPIVTWGVVGGWYDPWSIAIDGSIIPGMSGGPVVNEDGLVCGMNVATTNGLGRALGIIIPISEVLDALERLEASREGSTLGVGG